MTSTGNFQSQSFPKVKDINADEVEQVDSVGNQLSEATMDDADILENGKDEAPLDADCTKILDEKRLQFEPSSDGRAGPELVRGRGKLQTQGRWRGVDPILFYRDEAAVGQIKAFYGIKESFPFKGHLIVRNSDISHVKRVYYVSKSVKEVLELNFLAGEQLKIAAVGLKMFVSCSNLTLEISVLGTRVILYNFMCMCFNVHLLQSSFQKRTSHPTPSSPRKG